VEVGGRHTNRVVLVTTVAILEMEMRRGHPPAGAIM